MRNGTPAWTPTQRGDHYMLQASGREPAIMSGQRVVGHVVDDRDPRRRIEIAVSHLPYELWMDDAGNILQMPTRTTRCLKRRGQRLVSADDSSHREEQYRLHLAAGWLSWERGTMMEPLDAWLARRDAVLAERRGLAIADAAAINARMEATLAEQKTRDELAAEMPSFADGARERKSRAARIERGPMIDG